MVLSEPIAVTVRVAGVLEELGVRYLVGGSLASSLHGIPRATYDVDLVADLGLEHVAPFVNALRLEFYVDADMIRDAIRRRASFNIIHLGTMLKLDIFVLGADPLSHEEMNRRVSYAIGEQSGVLYLCSAEDIILQKLTWFELGERVSDRQWSDLLGVMKVEGLRLDLGYLRRWAATRGHLQLLEKALSEAGLA